MSIVIFVFLVIVLVALGVWAITLLTALPPTPRGLLQALVVLVGIYAIGQRAGVW